MTTTKKQLLLFIFLVIFGVAIRLINFGQIPFSLFSDEVDIGYQTLSFRETGRDYFGNFLPLQFRSFSDVRTALPIYATILVSYFPGISVETAIRLTPLLFAAGSLILIYLFINALWEHLKMEKPKGLLLPGHFAVFSLGLIPWHFTYSRTGFELSMLFFATLLGLYIFLRYLKSHQTKTLVLSLAILGLTPLIYSTAKLAVIGFPLILWLLADDNSRKKIITRWYLGGVLFLPLVTILIIGGASQRFSEIAIFTDPTMSSEINHLRLNDLGSSPSYGTPPSIPTKIAHNKATYILSRFFKNTLNPLSISFLFIAGDENLRHALPGWGMLTKTFLTLVVCGLFCLVKKNNHRFVVFLLLLTVVAIAPAALTRDGADHSSRLFMLILPLVIVITTGWTFLNRFKLAGLFVVLVLLAESFYFFHDYFYHYPYLAEQNFHYGLKQIIQREFGNGRPLVISPRYEPPLIFYLFYTKFPPAKFQALIKNPESLYRKIDEKYNLEGFQLSAEPFFAAAVRNANAHPTFTQRGVYYLTFLDAAAVYGPERENIEPAIKSPSGLPLFYRIEVD